jgi:hypothetical protein
MSRSLALYRPISLRFRPRTSRAILSTTQRVNIVP